MNGFQPKDSRGYFMLPQAPEDAGYYVYGNLHNVPRTGAQAQYAHPNLLTVIFHIEREWQSICDRKFGIGNISIDGGEEFDRHKTHRRGIEMDCRPVRRDRLTGPLARCTYQERAIYDGAATTTLIRLFSRHPWVRLIYFNDPDVQQAVGHVHSSPGHNDHFHVELLGEYAS